MSEPTTWKFDTYGDDVEMQAIQVIQTALREIVSHSAQRRVLRYVTDRIELAADGNSNTCDHISASGVDTTPINDPAKVWACDHCGLRWRRDPDAAKRQFCGGGVIDQEHIRTCPVPHDQYSPSWLSGMDR